MNSLMHRLGPPALVFGAAIYLGWPPASPLDLGESVVKAKAVRWKKEDLAVPPALGDVVDPFREVLVASVDMEVEPETGKLVAQTEPSGPSPDLIMSGLRVTGIANIGGRHWAIINGKPRLAGDKLFTNDAQRIPCEIVSVESDHVVVCSKETKVTLRPKPFGSRPVTADRTPANSDQTPQQSPAVGAIVPPPPIANPPQA